MKSKSTLFSGTEHGTLREIYEGVLLGTAVGDALGLPAENLSPERIRHLWKGDWRMRLVFGRGMISDDTEHTLMVAQTLLSHADDEAAFQRSLAWKFRWWFASLPGGVGLATAKACLKLWMGFPAGRAAVTSAGSGPAMRSSIIGAYFADDREKRRAFVLASSRLTHRGWQAETAALAVAECVALATREQNGVEAGDVLNRLRPLSTEAEWQAVLSRMESSLGAGLSVPDFIQGLGLSRGITGYSLHVVPAAIYSWLRHPNDFRAAMGAVLDCGGDTDTVGAILGAMMGASVCTSRIPAEWLAGILEWPHCISFMKGLATRLADQKMTRCSQGPVRIFWPAFLVRNLIFLAIILVHGFRRLAPPY